MWETGPLEHFGKRALAWEAMRDEHGKWVLRPSDRPRPPEGRITGVLLVQSGANGALVHAQVQSERST